MTPLSKSVLITGASSGIGLDLARSLAAQGWRVFAGVRRWADAQAVAAIAPARINAVLLDVTAVDSVIEARAQIETALAGAALDALVNNAGIVVAGPVEGVALADWRRQFEVNVFGVVNVTQAFLPLLRRGPGRIVMMSSVSGRIAFPWLGAYAASKHALEALSDALRMELAAERIGVTLIEPGAVNTPIWTKSGSDLSQRFAALSPATAARLASTQATLRNRFEKAAAQACAPGLVSAAVLHALTARRPPARLSVGREAWLCSIFRLMPARWVDRLILRSLGQ